MAGDLGHFTQHTERELLEWFCHYIHHSCFMNRYNDPVLALAQLSFLACSYDIRSVEGAGGGGFSIKLCSIHFLKAVELQQRETCKPKVRMKDIHHVPWSICHPAILGILSQVSHIHAQPTSNQPGNSI